MRFREVIEYGYRSLYLTDKETDMPCYAYAQDTYAGAIKVWSKKNGNLAYKEVLPSYIFIATATKYRYNICHKLLLWLVVGVTALYQGSLPQFGQDRTTSVVRECYSWLPLYSSHRQKTWRHGDLEGQGPLVGLPQICIPLWMPIHDQIRNLGT